MLSCHFFFKPFGGLLHFPLFFSLYSLLQFYFLQVQHCALASGIRKCIVSSHFTIPDLAIQPSFLPCLKYHVLWEAFLDPFSWFFIANGTSSIIAIITPCYKFTLNCCPSQKIVSSARAQTLAPGTVTRI